MTMRKMEFSQAAFLAVAFVSTLCALSIIRGVFFYAYAPASAMQASDVFAGLLRGCRFDAKWTAIAFAPATLFFLVSAAVPSRYSKAFFFLSCWFSIAGAALVFLLGLVNFGYFGFYASPINGLVFGFLEDDTWAVIVSVLKDWPVGTYLMCLILVLVPLVYLKQRCSKPIKRSVCLGLAIVYALAIGLMARGSFGTFPLRQTDLNATTNVFVNQAVNNGCQALYDALKERKSQDIGRNLLAGLQTMGFSSVSEARSVLSPVPLCSTSEKGLPDIVLVVMEAMGRDLFEAHVPGKNDTLGSLAQVLDKGDLFLNALSIENGTFPSLEGILFNSPISPISQSRYGYRPFAFSQLWDFKKAGYKTAFLSSGTSVWRNVDVNFRRHGFDEIYGLEHIKKRYGDLDTETWGVPDEYMFRFAKELLKEARQEGKPLFLVMLSTTNHPPYKTPRGYQVQPTRYESLPSWKAQDKVLAKRILETYQYSADCLGRFIKDLSNNPSDKTLLVATGDHNTRSIFEYSDTALLEHQFGVPVFFHVPNRWRPGTPNKTQWISVFLDGSAPAETI